MNTRQAVANRILQYCRERNLAVTGLARMSAVPPSTLKHTMHIRTRPKSRSFAP